MQPAPESVVVNCGVSHSFLSLCLTGVLTCVKAALAPLVAPFTWALGQTGGYHLLKKSATLGRLFVCHQMEREGPGQSKTLGCFFRSSFRPFLIHVVIATQGSGNVIFSSSMSQIHSQWMMSSPLQGFWATLVQVSHLSQRNAADADRKLHECGPLSH